MLKKGDVFKLKQAEPGGSVVAAYLVGKYIVSNVADREWYGSSNWKYKTKKREVFCESLEPQGTKISFFQSEEDLRIFGLKILGQPTQGLEIDLLEEEKQAETKDNANNAECLSCRYAHTYHVGNLLVDDRHECRRYPPLALFSTHTTGVSGGGTNYEYPDVFKGDWCGEFEKEKESIIKVDKKKGVGAIFANAFKEWMWSEEYSRIFKNENSAREFFKTNLTPGMISNMINNAVKDAVEIMTQRIIKNIKES